ncbi:selenoprotein K-like isoform X2 [Macrosteles quadrilineatus]|uniref:selenoprotein K-like isoform X2 n=1 Tax=Macrosteles quadrilineatus TaxID=74068 RepID=UPI0023E2BCC1|nr:selenoprotein K-like isoform X2 [Macrosteles quadrilineatus]
MPYVLSSGEVANKQPWGLAKITAFFWGILNFFFMFFRTLISPGSNSRGDRYTQDFRRGGGGPPRPPRRNIGGFNNVSTLPPPPCGGGG